MNAVALKTEEIRSLLVPLNAFPLLLPNAVVAEIIYFHELTPVSNAPAWVAGSTDWRQCRLPVVRFEPLLGEQVAASQRQRIVVCHSLSPEAKHPFIGIAASAIPRLVRVREDIVTAESLRDAWQDAPLRGALRVDGQLAVIPDLPKLEKRLSELELGF
ncbi:MAG: chemotaxis protein CheW [Gammaproteobacteria bacterium]|nr:MAG: chemotaxis protein CheW [Gammaproteobacteria bacterium]